MCRALWKHFAMPIYEYACSACGHELEVLQKLSDTKLVTCPECHADALVKKVSAAGFQLKGSGWYVTDFRNASKPAAKPADKSAEKAGSDAGGDKAADTSATPKESAKESASPAAPAAAKAETAPAKASPTTSTGGTSS
jgi:putative FmdB family regulatory protein